MMALVKLALPSATYKYILGLNLDLYLLALTLMTKRRMKMGFSCPSSSDGCSGSQVGAREVGLGEVETSYLNCSEAKNILSSVSCTQHLLEMD